MYTFPLKYIVIVAQLSQIKHINMACEFVCDFLNNPSPCLGLVWPEESRRLHINSECFQVESEQQAEMCTEKTVVL